MSHSRWPMAETEMAEYANDVCREHLEALEVMAEAERSGRPVWGFVPPGSRSPADLAEVAAAFDAFPPSAWWRRSDV